jgi:hypothetical protein
LVILHHRYPQYHERRQHKTRSGLESLRQVAPAQIFDCWYSIMVFLAIRRTH